MTPLVRLFLFGLVFQTVWLLLLLPYADRFFAD